MERQPQFIVIEGPDGCGKTSLAQALGQRLQARGLRHVARRQVATTSPYAAGLMEPLSQILWNSGDARDVSPRFWAYAQAAWFTALYETEVRAELDAGHDVIVDGWIYKLWSRLLIQGFTAAEVIALLGAVPRPDQVVVVDVAATDLWDRRPADEFRPAELGMHLGYATLDRASFLDYQERGQDSLLLLARTHRWPVLEVGSAEDVDTTVGRLSDLVVPLLEAADTPTQITGDEYTWPWLDPATDHAVVAQLHRSLSDRDAGGVIGEFEREFAEFAEADHTIAFSSGTSALHAMCAAAELGTDDEIIVPAYTFPATASPFAYEGVRVVFADADPRTGNIDPAHVEKLVTARTRAVLVTHLWGLPCDMDALSALCARHNLMLLEDCSHAHFARWRGKKVGTFGAMAAFSFNQKALSTGEGGILVTGDDRLRDLALLHGHYNQRSRQEIDPGRPYYAYARTGMGLKSRMHPLAAAVGLDQLNKAPRIEAARRATLARFAEALDGQHTVELCDVDPQTGEHGLYVAGFRVRPGSGLARDDLMRQLAAHGAGCFDVPGSTRDISAEPLFHRPARTSGWDTVPPVPTGTAGQFPGVAAFTQAFFKAPLWGHPHDVTTVERHLRALNDVAHNAST